ncbi:MAG: class I SAM-dependent methyltransferase [Desulfobacterales bacterium]
MTNDRIIRHYHVDENLTESVLSAIKKEKGGLDNLSVDDLIAIDGFHIRGRKSTIELAEMLNLDAAHRVLDIGAGSGGTARYLADRFGCRVIGIDLTFSYTALAAELAKHVGLSHQIAYGCANGAKLPFEKESFDIAWTDHIQMNIPDKSQYIKELRRVLKPGGKIALHEVFTGARGDPYLPAPWSSDPSTSFVIPADQMKTHLSQMNFKVLEWQDVTEISSRWFQKMQARQKASSPPPLGIHLLMGPNAKEKIANMGRSLAEGRARVIMGVLQKI